MAKLYIVTLTSEEEHQLLELLKKGKSGVRKITRSHILLLANEGKTDKVISETLHVHVSTVQRTRKKFVDGGLDYALNERTRPGRGVKLDGKGEAFLVALACSDPPEGQKQWTMQLLADRLIELNIVDSLSDEMVRSAGAPVRLKKTR